MKFSPTGIVVPIITPTKENGVFNEIAYRKLIEYLARANVHGIFPLGTTGEFYAFNQKEYRRILDVTIDAVAGRMKVYAGANHITTRGVVELVHIAEEARVDALSILTPMFISQNQDELYSFYSDVANETSLPIIIYNNKPKTNITVSSSTIARLARIKNIVGVKDSSGDFSNTIEYIRLTRGLNFNVLMGRDTLIYAALCCGASGAISSCANIAPHIVMEIYNKYQQGDYQGALEAQFQLIPLRNACEKGSFPVVIKEGLNLLGMNAGDCVLPIKPLNDIKREELRKIMIKMHLISSKNT